MIRRASSVAFDSRATLLVSLLGLSLAACSDGDAQKSWNALSTCLAGPAAQSPLAARVAQLRAIQLGNPAVAKDAWPRRCGGAADDLYAALGSESDGAMFKRKLHDRLGCSDTKGSCTLPTDSTLISIATELWEGAKSSNLNTEPAPGVGAPQSAVPLIAGAAWQSFSAAPLAVVGPLLTPDGRANVLLKAREGNTRPRGCEFSAGFAKVSCFDGHEGIPELPAQTVDLVSDLRGIYSTGLTEKGLVVHDLKSGQLTDARGMGPLRFVHDGLAVERGAKDEGFQLVSLSAGKASKPTRLSISPLGDPLNLGNQVVFLEQAEGGAQFVAKSLVGGRIKDVTTLKGTFSGALHGCRRDSVLAVAAFSSRAGQHNAKPTAGDGKTQVTVTLFQGSAWTKPASITIPFERGVESDLVCTKSGASLSYAQSVEGGILVGRVDCDASGCKASDAKLPGVESKWWWAAGPLGDRVLIMWRAGLGETRMRIAPIAGLAAAKDVIVFDAPDFGGPNAGELNALYADDDALLLFRGEKPVAMHVGADGAARVLTP